MVVDPVYSGKALYGFLKDVAAHPGVWQQKRVLFLHTGGLLSMYDKADQLLPLVQAEAKSSRLQVP